MNVEVSALQMVRKYPGLVLLGIWVCTVHNVGQGFTPCLKKCQACVLLCLQRRLWQCHQCCFGVCPLHRCGTKCLPLLYYGL